MEIFTFLPSTNLFVFFGIIYILISIIGFIRSKTNIILILVSLEIHFLSYHLILISSSIILNDISGIIFSLFCLTVAGAEVAVGLALIILFYKSNRIVGVNYLNRLKG
jgi:NADH:ubiquinone oxidoreductase subunit K